MVTLTGLRADYEFSPDADFVSGGTGRVYKGVVKNSKSAKIKNGKEVAVKVLYRDLTHETINIKREQDTSDFKINHPNLLEIYDFIEVKGIYHTISEWLDGEILSERLTRLNQANKKLTEDEIQSVLLSVLTGLTALHERQPKIVHRDVKPSNIMMCTDGTVKLLDFGIAKSLDNAKSTRTGLGTVIGSLAYAPPEQVKGEVNKISPASDIYSLGIMLYELFVGDVPFEGTEFELMKMQVSKSVPEHPVIPKKYQVFINRATAKAQEKRFKDAGDFLNFAKVYEDKMYVSLYGRTLSLKDTIYGLGGVSTLLLLFTFWVFSRSQNPSVSPKENAEAAAAVIEPPVNEPAVPVLISGDSLVRDKKWDKALVSYANQFSMEKDTAVLSKIIMCVDSLSLKN